MSTFCRHKPNIYAVDAIRPNTTIQPCFGIFEQMSDFVLPETRYALSGDVNIAYQVMGDGPVDLVLVPGLISHVEFLHELPGYTAALRRLSRFAASSPSTSEVRVCPIGCQVPPRLSSAWMTFALSWIDRLGARGPDRLL